MIKKSFLIKTDNTQNVQQAQVQCYDDIKDIELISQYGFYSSPTNGCQVVEMQVNGQAENVVGIANDVNNQPKTLANGETMQINLSTGAKVYCQADGSILITSPTNTVNIDNLKHTGTKVGFFNADPIVKPTVAGIKGSSTALASLIAQLVALGLITDITT